MADYVTVNELKASLQMTGTTYADPDIQNAVSAASRVVDSLTGRSFSPGSVGEIRWFTPVSENYLIIGDVISITELQVDGTVQVVNTAWFLDQNDTIRPLDGAFRFPVGRRAVKVTGQWGWTTPPVEVKQATSIVATQLVRRVREAPFGVVAFSLEGTAIRLGKFDPQVEALLSEYTRSSMVE